MGSWGCRGDWESIETSAVPSSRICLQRTISVEHSSDLLAEKKKKGEKIFGLGNVGSRLSHQVFELLENRLCVKNCLSALILHWIGL